jgi:3-oxoacyl-[acyl-carrier protein] reductase
MSKLTGKVAVVTGASKSIGAGIAKSLAAAGGDAIAVRGDVSDPADATGLIDATSPNLNVLGVILVTQVAVQHLGEGAIRINPLNPGFTIREGTGSYVGSGFADGLIVQVPLGRAAQPEHIASVVVFLASDDSGWLTGELINASGGLR